MAGLGDHAFSHEHFAPIGRRALIPLITRNKTAPTDSSGNTPDPNNIQGDIIYLFSKFTEAFVFFRIGDVPLFRKALSSFKPTHGKIHIENLHTIRSVKAARSGEIVPLAQQQIAFSRAGLNLLGLKDKTGDARFDTFCMRDNKDMLGDRMDWDKIFDKPNSDPIKGTANVDEGAIHGVASIAASDFETGEKAVENFKLLFDGAIEHVEVIRGKERPGEMRGHEHFGYLDGVSQPAIRNLISPHPGQTQVDPGVIITGYEGDPVPKRPGWAKDGTFMVFRKLEQDVLGFQDYLNRNGPRWREFVPPVPLEPGTTLSDEQGTQLWGARIVGRWPSGAPLAKCPVFDDPAMGQDENRRNDFDYSVPGVTGLSDKYCPFKSHTRKMNPRKLGPYLSRKFIESSSIIRAGVPYGEELPDTGSRGLLFVCYQSHLDSGFVLQTTQFGNNDYFPATSLIPQSHGQDPIIGGPELPYHVFVKLSNGSTPPIEVQGIAQPPTGINNPPGVPPEFFVTSRGGEYFFVPSISTLKEIAQST